MGVSESCIVKSTRECIGQCLAPKMLNKYFVQQMNDWCILGRLKPLPNTYYGLHAEKR